MNKADLIFKANIRRILKEGCLDENPRPRYESDGKPAHSQYISMVYEEYDLDKGELPLTTLRPIAVKGGINELLAIYQTQTNTQEGFEYHNINWWIDWMNDEGNIGRAYSYNLESHRLDEMKREIVEIEKRLIGREFGELLTTKVHDIASNYTEKFDEYQLLDVDLDKRKYLIQSLSTGETQWISRTAFVKLKTGEKSFLSKGSPFIWDRTFYGVGYIGNLQNVFNMDDATMDTLKRKWVAMLKRCYSDDSYYQKYYSDTFVHQEWHSFEQFLKDVRYLPQYHLAKEDGFKGWELDKDYFGSNCYSKNTVVFLRSEENSLYNKSHPMIAVSPSGEKELIINLAEFCFKHDLNYGNAHATLTGKRNHVNGYTFSLVENDGNTLYRYELSRNQVNELISGIKRDPYSRRHMLSFFNWSNHNKKMLVECAFQSLYTVRKVEGEYYLDAALIQRSSDYPTAGHINCMQYVALQMMIAHECGMKVGKFGRFTQNLHLYDRHVEQAEELLNRPTAKDTPKLVLNAEGKSFYEITIDDFELIGYTPTKPQLKFELGI